MPPKRRGRPPSSSAVKKKVIEQWVDAQPSVTPAHDVPGQAHIQPLTVIDSLGQVVPASHQQTQVTWSEIIYETAHAALPARPTDGELAAAARALQQRVAEDELAADVRCTMDAIRRALSLYSGKGGGQLAAASSQMQRGASQSLFFGASQPTQQQQQQSQQQAFGVDQHQQQSALLARQQALREFNAANPSTRKMRHAPSLTPLDAINTVLRQLNAGHLVPPHAFENACRRIGRAVAEEQLQSQHQQLMHLEAASPVMSRRATTAMMPFPAVAPRSTSAAVRGAGAGSIFSGALSQDLMLRTQLSTNFLGGATPAARAPAASQRATAGAPSSAAAAAARREPPLYSVFESLLTTISSRLRRSSGGRVRLVLRKVQNETALPPGVKRITVNNYLHAGSRALFLFDLQLPRVVAIVGAATHRTQGGVHGGTLVVLSPIADPAPFVLRTRSAQLPLSDCVGLLVERRLVDPSSAAQESDQGDDDGEESDEDFVLPGKEAASQSTQSKAQRRRSKKKPSRAVGDDDDDELNVLARQFVDKAVDEEHRDEEAGDGADIPWSTLEHFKRDHKRLQRRGGMSRSSSSSSDGDGSDGSDKDDAGGELSRFASVFGAALGGSLSSANGAAAASAAGVVRDTSVQAASNLPRVDGISGGVRRLFRTNVGWHMRLANRRTQSLSDQLRTAGTVNVAGGGGASTLGSTQLSYGGGNSMRHLSMLLIDE